MGIKQCLEDACNFAELKSVESSSSADLSQNHAQESENWATEAEQSASNAALKATEAAGSASAANTAKTAAELAKTQAQAISDNMVAELPDGTINDATIAPNTAWSSTKINEELLKRAPIHTNDIYGIGTVGEIGFGVSCLYAPEIPAGFTIGAGYYIKGAADFARLYDASGSHMVAIRKHYMKIDGNNFSFYDTQESGSVLPRMFINAGVEIPFMIVDIHTCGIENGVWVSKPGLDPASTNSAHNPISQLSNTPANNYGGLYKAAKTRGANYFLTPKWVYTHLAKMAKAHGQAATSTAACAYIDVNPKMPKGNLNNALRDVNDASVTFTASGYLNCALTGSGVPYAKTTHNGQACGIADLNGNMWEVASGFIRYDATGFLMLKESVDIRAILTDSTTTGGGGAYDRDLYDVVDLDDLGMSTAGAWTYFGNGSNQVFAMNTDRTSNDYRRSSLGIPNATGVSGSGTIEFGNDGLYKYTRNEMACFCGGGWGTPSGAGVFALYLSDDRTYSSALVGGRASYIV